MARSPEPRRRIRRQGDCLVAKVADTVLVTPRTRSVRLNGPHRELGAGASRVFVPVTRRRRLLGRVGAPHGVRRVRHQHHADAHNPEGWRGHQVAIDDRLLAETCWPARDDPLIFVWSERIRRRNYPPPRDARARPEPHPGRRLQRTMMDDVFAPTSPGAASRSGTMCGPARADRDPRRRPCRGGDRPCR